MEALRARTREPGLADPAGAVSLSGLAFLQAIVAGAIPDPPITRTATAEGRLVDADGKLNSHGTSTCLLHDL